MDGWSGVARRAGFVLRQLGTLRLVMTFAVLVLAVMLARYSWSLVFAQDAEAALYDLRSAVSADRVETDPRIVVIAYTEETLALTGRRSPVDRRVLAKALRRIDGLGAKSISIDVLVDQAQPEDAILAGALKSMRTPTWLAYASHDTNGARITFEQQHFLEGFLAQLKPGRVRPASIRLQTDSGDVLRRWPQGQTNLPPLLPHAGAGMPSSQAHLGRSIDWRRPATDDRELFTTIPIHVVADDMLAANPEADALLKSQIAGKYVLIGGHIQDIDLFATPVTRITGTQMWGVDVFAQMLSQQLDGRSYLPLADWLLWAAALLVVVAATITALGSLRPFALLVLLGAQLVLIGALPFLLHNRMIETYGLPVFGWGSGWVVAFLATGTAVRALSAEQRRFAQSALGRYLPRDIATQILRDPEGLSLKGETRELFIVFSDLEGFTKLSHAIDPGVVASLLNRYLETLSEVVLSHGGTIDKFVGDAVVAFWGAPIARPDDGQRAVRAAMAMHQAGEDFRRSVPDGVPAIGRTRVGVHFGSAIVGNFGGEGRIQYTALGDAMNTASRLENANKQLGTSVLLSAEAVERSGLNGFRPLGTVVLRGRATPVDIFEPSEADPAMIEQLARAIAEARRGDERALLDLQGISALHPNDAALRNLVYRMGNISEGGHFVLD